MEALDILNLPTLSITDSVELHLGDRYISSDLGIPIEIGIGRCVDCCLLDTCIGEIHKGFACEGFNNIQPLTVDKNTV